MFFGLSTVHVQAQQPKLNSSGSLSGPGVLTPESWGMAKTTVENPTSQDQSLLLTVCFNKDAKLSNVQFARQFWIPAGARRELYVPFKAPDYRSGTKSVNTQVQLLDIRGSSDVFLSRDVALYRTSQNGRISAMMFSPHSRAGFDLIGSLRKQMGNSYTFQTLRNDDMPRVANLLQSVNALLIGDDQLHFDPMQMQALRQWLLAGGQMIVLLPETGIDFCRSLLGDHLPMQVVDKTSLETAAIKGKNIFIDGSMTARISNKDPQPRGWKLAKLKKNRVDVHGGGTRLRNPDSDQSTVIENSVEISPSWSSLTLTGRIRLNNSNTASGVVMRAQFRNQLKEPVGQPIDLVHNAGRGLHNWRKQVSVPNGATHLRLQVGLEKVKGTLWASGIEVTPEKMLFEQPVEFWRVLAPTMQTQKRLFNDGWPMMLRTDVGRGRVTILTVSSDYWTAVCKAGSHMVDEAFRTSSNTAKSPIDAAMFAKASTQQIGYKVLSRTPVMGSLLAMLAIMVVVGLVLWHKGSAEWLAPMSVVLALVVAGVIWGLGLSHHRQTPLTIASVQLAQIDPVSNYAITDGVVCTYSPSRLKTPLAATHGGVIWPDLSGSTGKLLRMRWTDCDKWQWDNMELAEGTLRTHAIDRVVPLDQPVKAVASFTRDGMTCTITSGPYAGVDHPIIASMNNHAVGKLTGHDTFSVVANSDLGLEQFVASTTMTATDIQRQEIYRDLIYPDSDALNVHAYPMVPSAMWWARAMDMGFTQGSSDAKQKQTALVCVPLTFERPAPGTTFTIPSPVLQVMTWRDGSRAMSTILNPMTDRWTSTLSQQTTFKLAFQVPPTLLPLKVEAGTLDIDFKTPGRTLTITSANGADIAKRRDLANRVLVPVNSDNLRVNKQGQIIIGFDVSEHVDPASSHMWDASGGIRLSITAVAQ